VNIALMRFGQEWSIADKADYELIFKHRWLKHSKGYAYRFERDENGEIICLSNGWLCWRHFL